MEETHKGVDELDETDDNIQDEINVSSSKNMYLQKQRRWF